MVDRLRVASKHIDRALKVLEEYAREVDDPRTVNKLETLLWKLLEVRIELSIIKNTYNKKRTVRRTIQL